MTRPLLPAFLLMTSLALPAPAAPAAGPAAANNFSTPRHTFDSLIADLRADDLKALRACFTDSTDLGKKFMDVYTEVTITTHRLAKAMKTHMAADTQAPPDLAEQLEKPYADAKVETEGATAWLLRKGEPREKALTFTKVGNAWKIDTEKSYNLNTDQGRKAAEGLIQSGPKMVATFNPLIAEINAGKIKTIAQLRQRLAGSPPTSQPATQR